MDPPVEAARLLLGPVPGGACVGAFLDLDRTLIAGYSALAFGRDLLRSGRVDWWDLPGGLSHAIGAARGGDAFTALAETAADLLAGVREATLREIGERLFEAEYRQRIHPEARELVAQHRALGHTLVIASAATAYQVFPIARSLGVDHVLCTRLETFFGRITGRVEIACWGEGKLAAVRRFAGERGIDLAESFFYSDGHEDLPLLRAVGRPRPTNPDASLERVAREAGWQVLRFEQRRAPTALELVRPLLARGPWRPAREILRDLVDEPVRAGFRVARLARRLRRRFDPESGSRGRP